MPLLLGIDIGTSSVKAVIYDPDSGAVIATAGQEYPLLKPAPDRAEQEPEAWWEAAKSVVQAALVRAGRRDIMGIGVTGHMHGVAFLDRLNHSVRPAIIWADQRSGAECQALIDRIGADHYTAIAGTLPAAGFAAATLSWLLKYEPETLDHTYVILLPKDYVRYKLTGNIATDASDAAATGLLDVSVKAWSPEIVGAVGISRTILPPLLDSAAVAGTLTPSAAEALNLTAGIPVVTGCADQAAQAVANGLIAPGTASITIGSGGQVCVPISARRDDGEFRLPTDPRAHVFNHAVPGMWYILGATLSAGLSLRWLRDTFSNGGDEKADYLALSDAAAKGTPGAGGLLFLPYLSGERTPHLDPLARGAFIGLSYHHTRGDLARAVMEGVAFSMRETLHVALSISLNKPITSLVAAGGAMESPVWRQIMADILGLPLCQTALTETTGVGAALLAGVGVGMYENYADASAHTAITMRVTEPDARNAARYDALYAQYLTLYPKLKNDFHQLGRPN